MAISFIGATSGTASGSGVSLPGSYQDGDLVVAFGYNRGSTTAPTAPSGYTLQFTNPSSFTNRCVLYTKVISGDTTFPGFTGTCSHYALAIYRGQHGTDFIGGSSTTSDNTATISYADFTEEVTDGTSWIIACGAHRNNDSGSITHDSDWTSRTFYNHVDVSNNGKIGIGDQQNITSFGGDTVATLGAANGHGSITFELLAAASTDHSTTVTGVASATSVGAPALTQNHALGATGVASATSVGVPNIGGNAAVSINGVSSATSVETPTVTHNHVHSVTSVVTATSVGTPAITTAGALAPTDVSSVATVGTPAITQNHVVGVSDTETATSVGTPTILANLQFIYEPDRGMNVPHQSREHTISKQRADMVASSKPADMAVTPLRSDMQAR